MSDVSYYFLPWVRYGLWKGVQKNNQDLPELGQSAGLVQIPERVKVPVKLKLIKNADNGTEINATNLSLFGPGDVVGIDAREIVRTEPRHLTHDFLPNLFPFIEFDRPDFPWLFTPGKPDANDCLLPWIVLVVLPKEQGEITTDPTKTSPELKCAISELPDLKESWAWAHAQYIGKSSPNQENIPDQLASEPHKNVSRLLCPRKLKPNEHYLACVVPAFKVVESKDQNDAVTRKLEPAWKQSDEDDVTLPIYYQWEFSTAAEGDFEDFISRLKKPDQLDEKANESFFRRMDVSSLMGKNIGTATLDIISALELESKQSSANEKIPDDIKNELNKRINDSHKKTDNVPLPIYGIRHIQKNLPGILSLDDGTLPNWLTTLNRDPRYRVAAALGTQVIQRQQEQLMAAAWEQATGLDTVNQMMKQKQLAREVTNSFFKRIEKLSDDAFLQVTQPVVEAIAHSNQDATLKSVAAFRSVQRTSTGSVEKSIKGKAILSACGRRMLRPQGRLLRQCITSDEQRLAMKRFVTSRVVTATIMTGPLSPTSVVEGAPVSPPSGVLTGVIPTVGSNTAEEAVDLLQPSASKIIRAERMAHLRPDDTFSIEMKARLKLPENVTRGLKSLRMVTKAGEAPSTEEKDPLAPITYVPLSFPQPMYEPLRDLFQEMLIPGLDQIPNNSLVILKTRPAFIEAYMVGLNHEMSRELLWREFPTHLGRTYFQKFWDDRGSGNSGEDIEEIVSWNKELGENIAEEKGDLWVLLIKGDLLVRYPNTIIYAQNNGSSTFPVLRVSPVPGVTLLGFSIDPLSDKSAGWSFVIEEHPTETRFGLDISREEPLSSWRDLTWEDIVLRSDSSGYIVLNPEPADDEKYKAFDSLKPSKVSWDKKNSASMAYITLQKPFRYIIPSTMWFKNNESN